MTSVPFFAHFHFNRNASRADHLLSLSSGFLGITKRVTVFESNQARLSDEPSNWKDVALRITILVVFSPATLFFALSYLILRPQYHFTVCEPRDEGQFLDIAPDPEVQLRIWREKAFHSFEIWGAMQWNTIRSDEQIKEVAKKIALRLNDITDCHKAHKSWTPYSKIDIRLPEERQEWTTLLAELEKEVVIVEKGKGFVMVLPKHNLEFGDDVCTLTYENGVVDEIEEFQNNKWVGKRTYPNGTVHFGRFNERYWFEYGMVTENETVYYHLPGRRHFGDITKLEAPLEEKVILTQEYDSGYVDQYKEFQGEDLTTGFFRALESDHYPQGELFRELFSQIDKKKLVMLLEHEYAIFNILDPNLILLASCGFRFNLRTIYSPTGKPLYEVLMNKPGRSHIPCILPQIDPEIVEIDEIVML